MSDKEFYSMTLLNSTGDITLTKNLSKKKAPCFSYGNEFLFLLTFL